MRPILTLTLNPALDLASTTPQVTAEVKLRCTAPHSDPGGGGINISRALLRMGGTSTAFVALAGPAGAEIAALLGQTEIKVAAFPAPGPTRQSLTVTEEASGQQYRFVMPGPMWQAKDTAAALQAIAGLLPPETCPAAPPAAAAPLSAQMAAPGARPGLALADASAFVVLSGSQPPGVPQDFPAALAALAQARGAALLLDTSGPALAHLRERPAPGIAVLRMDDTEAETLAGRALPALAETATFAATLVAAGLAQVVVIARGAEGSVAVSDKGRWHCRPPVVPVRSKVGAGDSFMAGFTLALAQGSDLPGALRQGTAAAAAAVMTEATELCQGADVARILPDCVVAQM
ncbi:1-phosphofructokinase family hexose kinase [Phaeovulum sp. W22_SRMD_FR3]|uniref:1-phosphofructokinase family hexose kinase n=1 Tax=Phaeovulum sp. W22_SRMD_FR3 TaxID=3240274 RepID=UPI003F965AE0